MESATEISSILEFLGFSYSTPARVALEYMSVCKKEKKKEKKKDPDIKSLCSDWEHESKREFITEMETEFIGGCMAG